MTNADAKIQAPQYTSDFIYSMAKRQLAYLKKARLASVEHFKKLNT